MRRRIALILALMGTFALAACDVVGAEERGSFDRTLKVTGPVTLDVETGAGGITVRTTGATDTVQIRADVTARGANALERVKRVEANPPIEQSGNSIRIGRRTGSDLLRNMAISYELVVPAQTNLRAHSGSGQLTINGIKGPVTAETGSGGITIRGVADKVQAQTGSGNIDVENVQGETRAETGSGSIEAIRVAGAFDGHTGSGNITLNQSAAGDVRVETGSGNLELENVKGALRAQTGSGSLTVSGEPTAAWSLQTGSGGVRFTASSQVGFDLYAHTTSGSIHCELPITAQTSANRRELRGKVRGGGPQVEMETGSGSITIQ